LPRHKIAHKRIKYYAAQQNTSSIADFQDAMDYLSAAGFYVQGAIVMGRLDTKGVGLKLWGRRRACSQDYPIALDPLLLGEHKHDHDFLFSFPFENAKAIMAA